MKEVVIYGGSFDPPHQGHLQCLLALSQLEFCDEVWMVPSGRRSDKVNQADFRQRILMCLLVSQHLNLNYTSWLEALIRVSPAEQYGETEGSWELIQKLKRDNPHCSFSLAIGSELIRDLPQWKHPELLETVPLVILQRPGSYSELPSNYLLRQTVEDIFPAVSSTQIRDSVKTGQLSSLGNVLLPEVLEYISKKQLYFSPTSIKKPVQVASNLRVV